MLHEIGVSVFVGGEFDLLYGVGVAVVDLAEGARRNYLLQDVFVVPNDCFARMHFWQS